LLTNNSAEFECEPSWESTTTHVLAATSASHSLHTGKHLEYLVWVHVHSSAHPTEPSKISLSAIDVVEVVTLVILVTLVPVCQDVFCFVNLLELLFGVGCCFFRLLILVWVPL
jgi:hypothetical protein